MKNIVTSLVLAACCATVAVSAQGNYYGDSQSPQGYYHQAGQIQFDQIPMEQMGERKGRRPHKGKHQAQDQAAQPQQQQQQQQQQGSDQHVQTAGNPQEAPLRPEFAGY